MKLSNLTIDMLQLIALADKVCSNFFVEQYLNEDKRVDLKHFTSVLNSYSNKLEQILNNRDYLICSGKLDSSLHDVSCTKDKAYKALNGLNTLINNCSDDNKKQILINARNHFYEVVNAYLLAVRIMIKEQFTDIDENILYKRYDLYDIQ